VNLRLVRTPTIYFVRHGETAWNAQGRLQGQRDLPLNRLGRRQSEEAAILLRALVTDVTSLDFVASPLLRTRETMERLRDAIGLDPLAYRHDVRLKELSFGRWEGLTWKDVRARDPSRWKARKADRWNFAPPQGESYAGLVRRVAPVFAELERDAVVVSHGGVARAMLTLLAGLAPDKASEIDVWQGRVLVVRDGDYAWVPSTDGSSPP
jgi:broad specificity phosphatase PhoE